MRTLVGVAVGTKDAETGSMALASRRAGQPVDQLRIARFDTLVAGLRAAAPQNKPVRPDQNHRFLPFAEAYFSNFIEGTEFAFDEAARIVFDGEGYLFFTIGERGGKMVAQDLSLPIGKVHRVHDDGRVPADNPFVKDPKALKTIWSYGHRNPQGLARHPTTGDLYDLEHGPRGGDEVNLVLPGRNYGWPVISWGMDYPGTPIGEGLTAKEGMEQPVKYWVPSIAPCGANFYTGDKFPKWKNNLSVASLVGEQLVRLELRGNKLIAEEMLFRDLGRIRHVIGGPDGALYLLLPTRIARMSPAN